MSKSDRKRNKPAGSRGRTLGGQAASLAGATASAGGAGGATVHERIAKAKTVDEIRQALDDAGMKVVIGSNVESLGVGACRVVASGIAMVLDEYPGVLDLASGGRGAIVMCGVKKRNSRAEASYDSAIYLKRKEFSSMRKLRADCDREADPSAWKGNFHPVGTTAEHVTAHEAGHLVERALISKYFGGYSETVSGGRNYGNAIIQWGQCTQATRVVEAACDRVRQTPYGKGKDNDSLRLGVSRYATYDHSETLAECISDYAANGRNANPLSVAVHDILKDELR